MYLLVREMKHVKILKLFSYHSHLSKPVPYCRVVQSSKLPRTETHPEAAAVEWKCARAAGTKYSGAVACGCIAMYCQMNWHLTEQPPLRCGVALAGVRSAYTCRTWTLID